MSLPTPDLPRESPGSSGPYEFGPFQLDTAERLLTRDGQPVALTPKAFDLLTHLVTRAGRLVEKRELMAALWPDTVVEEANLAYTVSALRKALGDGQEGEQFIQTVPTRGYRFVAAVTERPRVTPALATTASRRRILVGAAIGVALLAAALSLWRWMDARRGDRQVVRFELASIASEDLMIPAISPDGTRVVYAGSGGANHQLYLRPLDSLQATALPETTGAYSAFFSPDGRRLGFFVRNMVKTLDLATGQARTVLEINRPADFPIGGAWAPDGRIYYGAAFSGVFAVAATGGSPVVVAAARPGDGFHGWPQMLPDGGHLVFTAWRSDDISHAKTDILTLATGARRTILVGAVGAQYLATGHLAYIRDATLFAQRFDPRTLELSGPAIRVLDHVGSGLDAQPFYAASPKGTLVYHPGKSLSPLTELFWIAGGKEERLPAPPGFYADLALSADDGRLAVAPYYDGHQDVWVHEFKRGTWTRVTNSPVANAPEWNPVDGDSLVFTSVGREGLDLFTTRADGSSGAELLYASAYPKYVTSSAPGAGLVTFTEIRPETQADVWLLDVRTRRARPFLQTAAWEGRAALSPDGRWLAHGSTEAGRVEVYVRPVTGAAAKWLISTNGGNGPRWTRDGRSIVYNTPQGLMRVAVHAGETFSAEKPELLSDIDYVRHGVHPHFDIGLDGRLLLMKKPKDQPRFPLVVVQNWFAEFERTVGR